MNKENLIRFCLLCLWAMVFLFFILAIAISFIPFSSEAYAARIHREDVYNQYWCLQQGGVTEISLPDKTRVDCLISSGYAIETEFADKAYGEGVGQALHYAGVLDMYPGILVIVEDWKRDQKYVDRLYETIRNTCPSIRVWIITQDDLL